MVTPVNSDKPITTGTDSATKSNVKSDVEPLGSQNPRVITNPTTDTESHPDVENARLLYQSEKINSETLRPEIETPEQAKTLVNQILQQFSATPEDALNTQGGKSNSLLTHLLTVAPG